ncbi:MAG: hypothetical protein HY718_18210 [Planctomycetes bacterium]|nr:hypothetical protein [Planctomycetota bacterium]
MLVIGAALMPVGTLTFFVHSLEAALACLCVAAFGHVVWVVATQTLPGDLFPGRYVGYITGTAQTTGSIGNTLAMLAIGAAVAWVSYKPVFIVAGILHPIGTVIISRLSLAISSGRFEARLDLSPGSLDKSKRNS